MKRIEVKTWTAYFVIGLKESLNGNKIIKYEDIKKGIQEFQFSQLNNVLSTEVSPVDIVCQSQDEPHVKVSFIQYPRFPLDINQLKEGVLSMMEYVMKKFNQHRCVAVFPDTTVMLQRSDEVDSGIMSR